LIKYESCYDTYIISLTISSFSLREKESILSKKDIRVLFQIKKKYNIPRYVTYLIIIELCKIHMANFKKYECVDCGKTVSYYYIMSSHLQKGKENNLINRCSDCELGCVICDSICNTLIACHICHKEVCERCTTRINKAIVCDNCCKNNYY
jgi:hypothetical protein